MAINTLLIANRGEIACRIIQTARKMAIRCIAIFENHDQTAQHVKLADQAYAIKSYLDSQAIIDIAKAAEVDAIHPGYGFLAEDSEFALCCQQAEIIFIGPSAEIIQLMADKARAKQHMQQAGMTVIAGYQGSHQSAACLEKQANSTGYPLLIKAKHGGGGKGMRQVNKACDFQQALQEAKSEALASFANDEVLLEKKIDAARHIEIQILGDQLGNCIHLSSRDCSIQRRHQKIIEEAPAANLDKKLLEDIAQLAVKAAQSIQYVGAGTFEFLVDSQGRVYFIEMNTRLQVEHGITEMISGIDIVFWQILIAAGEPLTLSQAQIKPQGHAIEVRLCAEDSDKNFIPACGYLETLIFPQQDQQLRIDSGFIAGDYISARYDSLIAKLITWGESRQQAIEKMIGALQATYLVGIKHNLNCLSDILQSDDFQQANISTDFIKTHDFREKVPDSEVLQSAAVSELTWRAAQSQKFTANSYDTQSPWFQRDGWQIGGSDKKTLDCWHQGKHYSLDLAITPNQQIQNAVSFHGDNSIHIFYQGFYYLLSLQRPVKKSTRSGKKQNQIRAPMPAVVVAVYVSEAEKVANNQVLIVLEAMKMQQTIRADYNTTVKAVFCQPGQMVKEEQLLLELDT